MSQSLKFTATGSSVSDRRALLVGRAAEMRALEQALGEVRQTGETRVVTVLGASGIGKTRLAREFLIRAAAVPDRTLRVFRGSARDQRAAYSVFARLLRARFGLVEGMDPEAAKAQVRAHVAAVLEDRKVGDVVYFLGQLLGLVFQDSPLIRAVEGDAREVEALRRAIVKRFWEEDASSAAATSGPTSRQNPIVLVFDDLHAASDESLDLLVYLLENLHAPILVICVARPELVARRESWVRQAERRHTFVELSPLSELEAAAVMNDLLAPCGEAPEVDDLVDSACTLAGGNPALLEQMVRIFLDAGVLEATDDFSADEHWVIHPERLASVRLPMTVEDAVQARIASLAPLEREMLERAAAMGGVFWLGGLVAIGRAGEKPPEVWSATGAADAQSIRERLRELVDRDYILRLPDSTFPEDEEYVFKHNLERETLVKMTPPNRLARYHGIVADWLAFRENVSAHEEYLGMLAVHREKAGLR